MPRDAGAFSSGPLAARMGAGYRSQPVQGERHRWAAAKVLLRTLEFPFHHLLICFVDPLSRLPRDGCPPDAAVS